MRTSHIGRIPIYTLTKKFDFDPDAANYIARVEAQDGQPLEESTRLAYDTFFKGLKADGNFDKLKSACILAGARSLAGALLPLTTAMASPTNFNFVSGDRSRALGLKGNGTNKYLDLNRQSSADPQDSYHQLAWVSEIAAIAGAYTPGVVIASGFGATAQASHLIVTAASGASIAHRNKSTNVSITAGTGALGVYGNSRASTTQFSYIGPSGNEAVLAHTASTVLSRKTFLFGRNESDTGDNAPTSFGTNRVLFYSVGENINLSNVRSRLIPLAAALSTL